MSGSSLQEVDAILYGLEREFFTGITVNRVVAGTRDLETGKTSGGSTTVFTLPRVVVLEATEATKVVRTLSHLTAGREFARDGYFNVTMRLIIMRSKTLRLFEYVPDPNDIFVVEDLLYKVISPVTLRNNVGYMYTIRALSDDNAS